MNTGPGPIEGTFDQLSVSSVLKMVQLGQKSGILHLRSDAGASALAFQRGAIVETTERGRAPTFDEDQIAKAVSRVLRVVEGRFVFVAQEMENTVGGRQRLHHVDHVLLAALRLRQEGQ